MMLPRRSTALVMLFCLTAVLIGLFSFRFEAQQPGGGKGPSNGPTAQVAASQPHLRAPKTATSADERPKILDLAKYQSATRWGHEKEPALRAFPLWTEQYVAATPAQRQALEKEGELLAKKRREKV